MAKLELPKVGQAKGNVDDIGNVLVVLRDLDPNNSTCFVEELSATNVKQFDVEACERRAESGNLESGEQ